MARYTSPLDHVRVAAPCSASWDAMIGDARTRFCAQCRLNVYNLSGMTRREAEHLVAGAEGRLCVRFYRRADGTILTGNCPVGLSAIKRRLRRVASATFSAILGFLAGLGLYTTTREPSPTFTMGVMKREVSVQTDGAFLEPAVMGTYPADPSGRWVAGRMLIEERGQAASSPATQSSSGKRTGGR